MKSIHHLGVHLGGTLPECQIFLFLHFRSSRRGRGTAEAASSGRWRCFTSARVTGTTTNVLNVLRQSGTFQGLVTPTITAAYRRFLLAVELTNFRNLHMLGIYIAFKLLKWADCQGCEEQPWMRAREDVCHSMQWCVRDWSTVPQHLRAWSSDGHIYIKTLASV